METIFGDYYDHISDLSKSILMLIVFILHPISLQVKYVVIITSIIVFSLSLVHLGCQESIYNPDEYNRYDSLSSLKFLCGDKEKRSQRIKYSRYFGVGTYMLTISVVIIICKFLNKNT
jgi:hypothetical protein